MNSIYHDIWKPKWCCSYARYPFFSRVCETPAKSSDKEWLCNGTKIVTVCKKVLLFGCHVISYSAGVPDAFHPRHFLYRWLLCSTEGSVRTGALLLWWRKVDGSSATYIHPPDLWSVISLRSLSHTNYTACCRLSYVLHTCIPNLFVADQEVGEELSLQWHISKYVA